MSTEQLNILTADYQAYRGNVLKSVAELYKSVNSFPDERVKPFHQGWRTNASIQDLCSDIIKDSTVIVGNVFGGDVTCSDLPGGLEEAKLKVMVLKGLSQKLLKITALSVDVSPYVWERTYYLGNLTDWKSWVPPVNTSETTDTLFYKEFYVGVAASYLNIIDVDYYHESIARGVFVPFEEVDGYIWVVMPGDYTPKVSLNLVQADMELDSSILINSKRYKVWKSVDTHSGTFNLSFN